MNLPRKVLLQSQVLQANTFYLVDTSSQTIIGTLPSNPKSGDVITFCDVSGITLTNPQGFGLNTFRINVGSNSHTIQGFNYLILDENQAVSLVFYNNRWTIFSSSR